MLQVMFGRRIIVVCAGLVLVMILMAIFAPVVVPYDPNQDDLYNVLKGCSAEHWLGTDSNGRDVLSRIIYGASLVCCRRGVGPDLQRHRHSAGADLACWMHSSCV